CDEVDESTGRGLADLYFPAFLCDEVDESTGRGLADLYFPAFLCDEVDESTGRGLADLYFPAFLCDEVDESTGRGLADLYFPAFLCDEVDESTGRGRDDRPEQIIRLQIPGFAQLLMIRAQQGVDRCLIAKGLWINLIGWQLHLPRSDLCDMRQIDEACSCFDEAHPFFSVL